MVVMSSQVKHWYYDLGWYMSPVPVYFGRRVIALPRLWCYWTRLGKNDRQRYDGFPLRRSRGCTVVWPSHCKEDSSPYGCKGEEACNHENAHHGHCPFVSFLVNDDILYCTSLARVPLGDLHEVVLDKRHVEQVIVVGDYLLWIQGGGPHTPCPSRWCRGGGDS